MIFLEAFMYLILLLVTIAGIISICTLTYRLLANILARFDIELDVEAFIIGVATLAILYGLCLIAVAASHKDEERTKALHPPAAPEL